MGEDIVKRFMDFKAGNEQAFRFFYEKYYHALCLSVQKILKDDILMHDVVQEAFIELWKSRLTIESELHLKMFLYQVVRHRCLNCLKNKKVEEKYVQENFLLGGEGDFANQVIEQEVHRLVIQEIDRLPPEQKKVVLLHLEGKDNLEIATIMQVSVNTVKTHKARARKALKTKLDELLVAIIFFGL